VGQWSRKIIINHSLHIGSQFEYIQRAQSLGFSLVILNPNANFYINNEGIQKSVTHNATPEEHVRYCWENVISRSMAKSILVVAHSYGGRALVSAIKRKGKNHTSFISCHLFIF